MTDQPEQEALGERVRGWMQDNKRLMDRLAGDQPEQVGGAAAWERKHRNDPTPADEIETADQPEQVEGKPWRDDEEAQALIDAIDHPEQVEGERDDSLAESYRRMKIARSDALRQRDEAQARIAELEAELDGWQRWWRENERLMP